MKRLPVIAAVLMSLALSVSGQVLSNETLNQRIQQVHAEKQINITLDAAAKTSKLMAVSENFSKDDANRSGLLAMNFAIGYIYAGDALTAPPDPFMLSFWVLTKKPRFGINHAMTVVLQEEMLVIGSARYAAKPGQQMEYLNFEISRENLAKIAAREEVRFMLGNEEFRFTKSQMKLLSDMLTITETR